MHTIKTPSAKFLAPILTLILLLIIFGIQLLADFELQDDHRIARYSDSPNAHQQVPSGNDHFFKVLKKDLIFDVTETARFRPFTILLEVGLPRLLGTDKDVWRSVWITLAIIFAVLLYTLTFRLTSNSFLASISVLMLMLAPDPGPLTVWYRFATRGELFGAIFLVSHLLLLTYSNTTKSTVREILGFTLLGLAVLCKESFVLVIPAIAIFRVWIEMRQTDQAIIYVLFRLKYSLFAYLAFFWSAIAAIAVTAYMAPAESYGGSSTVVDRTVFSQGLSRSLAYSPKFAVWFIPVLLALLTGILKEGASNFLKKAWLPASAFILWTLPQYLLYATRGGMWDHYWMPVIFALSGLNVIALVYLFSNARRSTIVIAISIVAIWIVNAVRIDSMAILNYSAKTKMQQATMRVVAPYLDKDKSLVVVANMNVNGEIAFSLLYFLSHYGSPEFTALLYDPTAEDLISNKENGFIKAINFPTKAAFDEIDPGCIGAVIFLDSPPAKNKQWWSWHETGKFEDQTTFAEQYHLSLKKRKIDQLSIKLNYSVAGRHSTPINCQPNSTSRSND